MQLFQNVHTCPYNMSILFASDIVEFYIRIRTDARGARRRSAFLSKARNRREINSFTLLRSRKPVSPSSFTYAIPATRKPPLPSNFRTMESFENPYKNLNAQWRLCPRSYPIRPIETDDFFFPLPTSLPRTMRTDSSRNVQKSGNAREKVKTYSSNIVAQPFIDVFFFFRCASTCDYREKKIIAQIEHLLACQTCTVGTV